MTKIVHIGWFISDHHLYVCEQWKDKWVATRAELSDALLQLNTFADVKYHMTFDAIVDSSPDFYLMANHIGYLLHETEIRRGSLRAREYPFKVSLHFDDATFLIYRMLNGPVSFLTSGFTIGPAPYVF